LIKLSPFVFCGFCDIFYREVSKGKRMIIKNGFVYTKEHQFHTGVLRIEGKKISNIVTDVQQGDAIADSELEAKENEVEILDATDCFVIPGLIDIHFHGCMGADFCDGTKEALEIIARFELSQGITSICPASMTYPEETLTRIFANAADFACEDGATLVGINMEGPFISKEKRVHRMKPTFRGRMPRCFIVCRK